MSMKNALHNAAKARKAADVETADIRDANADSTGRTGRAAGFIQSEQSVRATWPRCNIENMAHPFKLAVILARARPNLEGHLVAMDSARFLKMAAQLQSLAVAHCNTGLTPRQETREKNLRAEVRQIAGWYGLTVECGGDPRGAVVRLHGPDVPRNGWGEGFAL